MALQQILSRALKYIVRGVPKVNVSANISYLDSGSHLKNKRIIITGGSKGLGYAMAKKFISEGASVLISGRNEKTLEEAAKELGCHSLKLDVTDISKHESFIKNAYEMLGGIDCLVNNAGISLHEKSFLYVTEEQFDAQFNTNLKGMYFLTQAFLKYKTENKEKGNILFVSSERGETVEVLPYGLTKAAITSFVKGLAARYIKHGIRINGIAPGVTASEMTGFDPNGNLYCDYNITKRVYLPEEVAEVASFLISDVSAPLNGQILVCNEGKTLNV